MGEGWVEEGWVAEEEEATVVVEEAMEVVVVVVVVEEPMATANRECQPRKKRLRVTVNVKRRQKENGRKKRLKRHVALNANALKHRSDEMKPPGS